MSMSSFYRHLRRISCAGILFLTLVAYVAAQGPTTGSIAGVFTDVSGAALADAKVTVTSPALVVPQSTVTSGQGTYRFPSLPPGTYSLGIEAPAFATATRPGILITAGFSATVDMSMALASQAQTIAVTAEAPALDTENTKIQNTFSAE